MATTQQWDKEGKNAAWSPNRLQEKQDRVLNQFFNRDQIPCFKERLDQQQRQCLTSQIQRQQQYTYNASLADNKDDISETPATYIASSPESSQLPSATGA